MGKSKSTALARLPKEQKCHFLIGPVSSWFMPNTTDIWTQPVKEDQNSSDNDQMDCDQIIRDTGNPSLSYFVYGSIGCFCYGEVHHRQQIKPNSSTQSNLISATVSRLIDIKEDNSRVACTRFLKQSPYPLVMALTENGSLVFHDCLLGENLVQYKKFDILGKIVGLDMNESSNQEHGAKRAKFNITQQINSCAWPDAKNVFLVISLLKEKTVLLVWLRIKDMLLLRSNPNQIDKNNIVEHCQKLDLNLAQYSSPACLIETSMLDKHNCLVAVAMDDGLITVVNVNLDKGQTSRIIKLARHNDQICSMSFYTRNTKRFPQGLLASVSRDGLMLIWDIENEFYFADYQAAGSRINWFSLTFVPMKQIYIAISNIDSGLTLFEIPEKTRTKTRFMEHKENKAKKQRVIEQTLGHSALIFNVEYDHTTGTLITSSLDGNHIFWSIKQAPITDNSKPNNHPIEAVPQFLYPGMLNNSRTHMLRHSAIREDLLGCALGKAGLRFYKIPKNTNDCKFEMPPNCSMITRKILKQNLSPTSLSWHPSHEYRLAIGTLEGKVFRCDITPRKASLVETEHKAIQVKKTGTQGEDDDIFGVEYQPIERNEESATDDKSKSRTDGVYSLCWGPNPASPHDISKQAIYAVGSVSHRLFIYYSNKESSEKMSNYLDEFLDRSLPEALGQASEVSWKNSMDLMALGTTDGKVIIVTYLEESHSDRSRNKLFSRLAVIQGPMFGDTYIQCLAWHPTMDKDDPHYYYLATSANESPAFVFNIKETILITDVRDRLKLNQTSGDGDTTTSNTSVLSAYQQKLSVHQKAITDIAWNPHEPNQLATCSFDRMAYVWSLDSSFMDANIIAKFSARDRLFTLEWSLVDTDLIFTSGHDSTVWAWRPSENRVQRATG